MHLNASRLLLSIFLLGCSSHSFSDPLRFSPLKFQQVKTESVTIAGKIVGRYFFVEFHTLDLISIQPSEYFISAYEDQKIPYYESIKPSAFEKVICRNNTCSYALEAAITSVSYTVGIGTSGSVKTISATLSFMPGNALGTPSNPSLIVDEVGINTVIVSYKMPDGYRPTNSGAWIGIWEGGDVNKGKLLGKAEVNSGQSDDKQALNELHLLVDATYTVGFASGPNTKDIVSTTTFKISPF